MENLYSSCGKNNKTPLPAVATVAGLSRPFLGVRGGPVLGPGRWQGINPWPAPKQNLKSSLTPVQPSRSLSYLTLLRGGLTAGRFLFTRLGGLTLRTAARTRLRAPAKESPLKSAAFKLARHAQDHSIAQGGQYLRSALLNLARFLYSILLTGAIYLLTLAYETGTASLAQLFWDLYILYFEIYYLILSNIPGLGYFALCVAVLLLDRLDRRDD